jgi:hypothetical protein
MLNENKFQSRLIRRLHDMFPEAIVLKNDPNYLQGVPDILILCEDKWAMLETKKARFAHRQYNQQFYVDKLNVMSFARFISPENEEEVLDELQSALRS